MSSIAAVPLARSGRVVHGASNAGRSRFAWRRLDADTDLADALLHALRMLDGIHSKAFAAVRIFHSRCCLIHAT